MDDDKKQRKDVPPATFSDDPEHELEEKLRRSPDDLNAKADVGSDESMDASDPSSAVQPGSEEPVPSSGYREEDRAEEKEEEGAGKPGA